MLQINEIKQRFNLIERSIDDAAMACQSSSKVPQELKDCVNQWERQSTQAKQILSSRNEENIRRCVDDLEKTGARAELALQQVRNVDQKVKDAVLNAHHELADLKMQLH